MTNSLLSLLTLLIPITCPVVESSVPSLDNTTSSSSSSSSEEEDVYADLYGYSCFSCTSFYDSSNSYYIECNYWVVYHCLIEDTTIDSVTITSIEYDYSIYKCSSTNNMVYLTGDDVSFSCNVTYSSSLLVNVNFVVTTSSITSRWLFNNTISGTSVVSYQFPSSCTLLYNLRNSFNSLYTDCVESCFDSGTDIGYDYGTEMNDTAITIFNGILTIGLIPINMFLELFNFSVLGINISAFVAGLLTLACVLIVIRLIKGDSTND